MSSHTKNPDEKQSTSSESSESRSDSDMDEAEENMEQLKLEEQQQQSKATKKVSSEPETSKNSCQECPSTNEYKPMAGPSGLQKPHLDNPDGIANSETKDISSNDNNQKDSKTIGEDVEAEQESLGIIEENLNEEPGYNYFRYNPPNSPSPINSYIPDNPPPTDREIKCTSLTFAKNEKDETPPFSAPSRFQPFRGATPTTNNFAPCKEYSKSSAFKRINFITDSARSSLDVSDIRSEIANYPESVCPDAQENLPTEGFPILKAALERTSSEASEANISEIQEDPPANPSYSGSSNASSSISSEDDHKSHPKQIQKESEDHAVQMTTSPGIGSIHRSEQLQVLPEEDASRVSPLPERRSELMEVQDLKPEEMRTTPEKGGEEARVGSGQSAEKPAKESSDQASGTDAEGTSMARGEDIEVLEFERCVGKSKREPQLGNSPPSDENLGSSPLKASATRRPNKKSRFDEVLLPTGRTGHDDGDNIGKHGYGNPQQDQSTSTSDSNDCRDSDKETAL